MESAARASTVTRRPIIIAGVVSAAAPHQAGLIGVVTPGVVVARAAPRLGLVQYPRIVLEGVELGIIRLEDGDGLKRWRWLPVKDHVGARAVKGRCLLPAELAEELRLVSQGVVALGWPNPWLVLVLYYRVDPLEHITWGLRCPSRGGLLRFFDVSGRTCTAVMVLVRVFML